MDDSILLTLKEIIRDRSTAETLEGVLCNRLKLENQVRILKRQGKKCFFAKEGLCTKVDIRCGERQQYELPEEDDNKNKPHRCNYQPNLKINEFFVLIVDDDPITLELSESYFVSTGVSRERIEKAGSVPAAQEILKQGKVLNRQYCIVLSDVKMKNGTGFDLVNHLVERNYNSRILLMSGRYEEEDFPKNYLGNLEIASGQTVVSDFFKKPVSFADFTSTIREIEREFQVAV